MTTLQEQLSNLDALTVGSWNETPSGQNYGQSITLTLRFIDPQALPTYYTSMDPTLAAQLLAKFGVEFSRGAAFSTQQQAAALAAFDEWTRFANISRAGTATDWSQTITFATLPFSNLGGVQAQTLNPSVASNSRENPLYGDVWLNSNSTYIRNGSYNPGEPNFETLLHEIGHALGLKHPVSQDSGGGDEGPYFQNARWNSTRYTVMSYKRLRGTSSAPVAPMLLDIAAIQRLYGANPNTNAGNDTYRFQLTNGWPVQAIWDAGGVNDTIDGSDQNSELHIDLNAGGESYVEGLFGSRGAEIHIAFQPIAPDGMPDQLYASNYIENAIGGSDDDTIIGNAGANRLEGRGGADHLSGGEGDDTLIGGTAPEGARGVDRLEGGLGFDRYEYSTGDGRDLILDTDGLGEIVINGTSLLTIAPVFTPVVGYGDKRTWRAEVNGAELHIIEWAGDVDDVAILRLEGAALGPGGSIDINAFSNGDLGISLDPLKRVESIGAAENLSEGHAIMLTVDLTAPAKAGEYARLSIGSGLADRFRIVTGAQTLVFDASGSLNIALEAGQSTFVYSLVSQGDVDIDTQINLTATLLDAELNPSGPSSTLNINFDAVDETAPTSASAGTAAHDVLASGTGISTTLTGAGDGDILLGDTGDDVLYADAEVDIATAIATGNGGSEGSGPLSIAIATGSDFMRGSAGGDTLVGSALSDVLTGGSGNDLLIGGQGDDFIAADHSISYFAPGPGTQPFDWMLTEVLTAGGSEWSLTGSNTSGLSAATPGNDVIHAGGGADRVFAGGGDDQVYGEDGADVLFGGGGRDTLLGGAGNDYVSGDGSLADETTPTEGAEDFIDGGDGDDILRGLYGADVIFGGAGNDDLIGDSSGTFAGDDYLHGENGNDRLWGAAGADTLLGGADNDSLFGDTDQTDPQFHGNDVLDGGSGDDVLVGHGGSDTLVGGIGNDQLFGEGITLPDEAQGDDYLDGGDGDDILSGHGGSDRLFGGAGADQLYGDSGLTSGNAIGDDYLDGGTGNDLLVGTGGDDHLLGGDGNDTLAGDSDDTPLAVQGHDVLEGGAGTDTLYGYAGEDWLEGGADSDYLHGMDGNDVLIGGAGTDALLGGAGNDEYLFADADLLIINNVADAVNDTAGNNTVFLSGSFSSNTVMVASDGASGIVLTTPDNVHGLIVQNALSGFQGSFVFGNGEVLSVGQLIGSRFTGNASRSTDSAGAFIVGGTADDTLQATGDGSTLSGGQGTDMLIGGAGSTTYLFEVGDGEDVIQDASSFAASGGTSINTIKFGSDVDSSGINFFWSAGTAEIALGYGAQDSIRLSAFSSSNVLDGTRTVDRIEFAHEAPLSWSELMQLRGVTVFNTAGLNSFTGTNINDLIYGASISETILAGSGDDVISGGGGSDILDGGDGSDTYLFNRGSGGDTINNYDTVSGNIDRLQLASDIAIADVDFFRIEDSLLVRVRNTTDQVFVSDYFTTAGLEEIHFGDGTVFTVGNVPWVEFPQNPFAYQRGDGYVTYGINDPIDGVLDLLEFGANVDPATVRVTADANGNLIFRFREPDGSLSSSDMLVFTAGAVSASAALDRVAFEANASIEWTREQVLALARVPTSETDYIHGTAGNDALSGLGGGDGLYGRGGDDTLDGGTGSDTLQGGDGNDVLRGGRGLDSLYGGDGSDTFRVEIGDAGEQILDRDTNALSIDRIEFGSGILPENVRISRNWDDLVLRYVDPATAVTLNVVTVSNYFAAGYQGQTIDEVRFQDAPGVVWGQAEILAAPLQGTALDETIWSMNGGEVMRGMDGNDILDGGLGNDDLDGGAGDDTLRGYEDDDIYRFARDTGSDTIKEISGFDRLILAAGILPSDVQLYRHSGSVEGDLVLVLNNGVSQLRVERAFDASGNRRIETIEFANGTVWNTADIAANTLDISGTPNGHVGTTAADLFFADHVSDGAGDPVAGDGDTMQASVTHTLQNNVENLTLTGILNLNGTGNALANVIVGNGASNLLNGAAGVDTMTGGLGDDTYVVDDSGGSSFSDGWADGSQDVIQENAGEGYDTLLVTAYSDTLPDNVERLVASGFTGSWSFYNVGDDLRRRLVGNAQNNVIDASGAQSNYGYYLDGAGGADVLIGGNSNDTYVVDSTDDVIIERGFNENNGDQMSFDTVESSMDVVLGANLEGIRLVGSAAIQGTGNELNNVLDGSVNTAGNVLIGGDGDDTYRIGVGDSIVETLSGGVDRVVFTSGPVGVYSLVDHANVETGELAAAMGSSGLLGDDGDNKLVGNYSGNTLNGGAGNDVIWDNSRDGSASDIDVLIGGDGDDHLSTQNGSDTLDGGAGNDYLFQTAQSAPTYATYIFGRNYDHDTIDIWTTPVTGSRIQLREDVDASSLNVSRSGADLIFTINGDTGSLRVLNFFIDETSYQARTGTLGQVEFVGGLIWTRTTLINRVRAAAGGGATSGDDAIMGTAGGDTIDALGGNDVVFGGAGSDSINGNDGSDELWGEAGDDELFGGLGNDTMYGGAGNDIYHVDSSTDSVNENAAEGVDTVQSTVNWTLSSHVENLLLLGTSAINGTGNADANTITGNVAANVLNGLGGADTLIGGDGNDTYVIDNVGDSIVENDLQGTDLVQSGVTYTLGANLENLTLTGSLVIDGAGNSLANTLTGNGAANTLDGGAGADNLVGGGGNDIYIVDDANDVITEGSGAGTDLVRSSVTHTLASNVENLSLTGTGAIDGTGNTLVNSITGNAANNTLNGGAGVDTLIGGQGDDTYVVDNTNDVVTELAGEGVDLVQSTATYTLGNNVENLTLTGSSTINGTGNALDNVLIGNGVNNTLTGGDGHDTLDGGVGTDTMVGGNGNDVYYVNVSTDVTTESANQGVDTVNSAVTRTLASNIELLFLTGTSAINGTGNSAANLLRGNSVNNTLAGGGGIDILEGLGGTDILSNASGGKTLLNGGLGTDTLTGTSNNDLLIGGDGNDALTTGSGADIIAFNLGDGQDTIASSTTRDNTLSVGGGAVYADLIFQKSGNNLILNIGATDRITFTNYYSSTSNRSVNTLQVVLEGSSDYDAGSSDNLRNKKISTFNFEGLVAAFDAARTANPSLTSWALTNALLTQHLSGSDTAAIGGDLAYRYGRFDTLSDISFTPAQGILSASNFGTSAQTLLALGSLQDATPRLS